MGIYKKHYNRKILKKEGRKGGKEEKRKTTGREGERRESTHERVKVREMKMTTREEK